MMQGIQFAHGACHICAVSAAGADSCMQQHHKVEEAGFPLRGICLLHIATAAAAAACSCYHKCQTREGPFFATISWFTQVPGLSLTLALSVP